MKAIERREKIKECLRQQNEPISATALAEKLSVSRQIIVGDVALLRAAGEDVVATPKGYILESKNVGIYHSIVSNHTGDETERELQIIVDYGCRVLDVTVEHPVYGQLTGLLDISSRYDISCFLEKCREEKAHSLSELTDGIHIHKLACPSEEAFQKVYQSLKEEGFICE